MTRALVLGLACTVGASCGDKEEEPALPGSSFGNDLLADLEVRAGGADSVTRRIEATRGTWKPRSGSGVFEKYFDDADGAHLATVLRGPAQRTIQVPVPSGIEPDRARLRVILESGGTCRFFGSIAGASTESIEPVSVDTVGELTDVVLALPQVSEPSLLVVEIDGSVETVGVMRLTFEEDLGGEGEALTRVAHGPVTDQRYAVAIRPGTELVTRTEFRASGSDGRGDQDWIASAIADGAGSARLRLAIEDASGVVAEEDVDLTSERWSSVRVGLPRSGGPFRLVAEVDGPAPRIFLAETQLVSRTSSPPTVLLITSDTHRGDHLGSFGSGGIVYTPALDELAARGLQFTNCFAPCNTTNPSHVALMTGTHVRDTRVANNTTALSDAATTLAEIYKAHGYRTFAATSVMHLTRAQSGLGQGFDRFNAPTSGKRDGRVAIQQMLEWVEDSEGHPSFYWIHVYDAHAPYSPPEKLLDRHYPEGRNPRSEEFTLGDGAPLVAPWVNHRKLRDPEYITALYRAAVDYVDLTMADVLRHPRMAQAIIGFSADHGESLGRDGVFWEHSRLNIATLHIPMIVAWPGCEPRQSSAPVELVDLGRTLLDLSEIDETFPGQSLLDAEDASRASEARYGLSGHGWTATIELDGWLLTLQIRPYPTRMTLRDYEAGQVELFNLHVDPEGTNDLVDEEFARAKKMRAALIRWLDEADPQGLGVSVSISEEARTSLEALGYGGPEGAKSGSWWTVPNDAPWVQMFER